MQNAIDSKVSGIAVTLSNADAVIPVAAEGRRRRASRWWRSTRASTDYKKAGAKMYFGSDETLAGKTIGLKLAQAGPGRQDAVRDPGAGLRGAGGPLRRA